MKEGLREMLGVDSALASGMLDMAGTFGFFVRLYASGCSVFVGVGCWLVEQL